MKITNLACPTFSHDNLKDAGLHDAGLPEIQILLIQRLRKFCPFRNDKEFEAEGVK